MAEKIGGTYRVGKREMRGRRECEREDLMYDLISVDASSICSAALC